jgi:protein involved in polysaccharide export with SLBB domain
VPDNPQTLELVVVRNQANSERVINTQLEFDPVNPNVGDVKLLPEDIVILLESTSDASQRVYVVGEVSEPGVLTYREDLTVLQAILDAGGMGREAIGTKVKVLREGVHGTEQIPVDMTAIMERGDKAQNTTLMSGDIVIVPGMSLQADIMVTGKVNAPGMVPYEKGMTAMKAIVLAGGLSNSTLRSQVRIMGSSGHMQPPFLLDMRKARFGKAENCNPVLQPGDLVVVLGTAPGNVVSVLGKVRRPGIVEYEDGLTALKAILRAGGFDQRAARSRVKIVRGEGERQQNFRANLENLLDKGDRSGDIALLPGDILIVPETFF